MKRLVLMLSVLSCVTACQSSAPAFQADRPVAERDTYQGVDGLVQYQRDQDQLRQQEKEQACMQAKVALQQARAAQTPPTQQQLATLTQQQTSACAGTRGQVH
jgi:hypothetical protein